MQDVPKIVRDRLRAATSAVTHPDADVLTAFAERSLSADERTVVLDHLARCGDCRDIVALSLPATEPMATAVRPGARGWLTWPALRWGFVAAGVIAITSLGIVQYQRRAGHLASKSIAHLEVASNEARHQSLAPSSSSGPAAKSDKIQTPPPSAVANFVGAPAATIDEKRINEKKSTLHAEAPRVPVPQPQVSVGHGATLAVGGTLAHGPRLANQWQQQNAFQKQTPVPAPPSPFAKRAAGGRPANMHVPEVAETVAVESQSAGVEAQTQNLDAGQTQNQPAAPQPSGEDYVLARVGKAKPAVTTPTAHGAAPVSTAATPTPPQAIGGPVLASSVTVPRWTINSAGALQRSFDEGSTWQDVDVNANPVSIGGTRLEVAAKTSRPKVKDTEVTRNRAATFRAVAANGMDVLGGWVRRSPLSFAGRRRPLDPRRARLSRHGSHR